MNVTNEATNTTTRLVTDSGGACTAVNLIPGSYTIRATQPGFQQIGAPMSVQKELMRLASIQTTMNIYGRAMEETKRQANSKVVESSLVPLRRRKRKTAEKRPTNALRMLLG